MLEGRSDALYFLLENRSWNDHPLAGIAINKDERRYHEAGAYNTFRDRLGSTAVEEYFQRLGLDCGLVLQVPAASVRFEWHDDSCNPHRLDSGKVHQGYLFRA